MTYKLQVGSVKAGITCTRCRSRSGVAGAEGSADGPSARIIRHLLKQVLRGNGCKKSKEKKKS